MNKITKLEPPAPPRSEEATVLAMIDRVLANPEVSVERIEQLFDLHQKVRTDHARRAYYRAFADLQATLPAVARKGKAHNDQKYARYEDIMEAIRGPLSAAGFSISFRTQQPDGKLSVTGILAHVDGHAEETTLTLPQDVSGGKNAVQAWGSSASYGKRYCILTLLGIATEDDDNGKAGGAGETITDEQFNELANLITETRTDIAKFLQIGGLETLSDMPVSEFPKARAMLLKKKAAK